MYKILTNFSDHSFERMIIKLWSEKLVRMLLALALVILLYCLHNLSVASRCHGLSFPRENEALASFATQRQALAQTRVWGSSFCRNNSNKSNYKEGKTRIMIRRKNHGIVKMFFIQLYVYNDFDTQRSCVTARGRKLDCLGVHYLE
jgi:hypothetical protein